ncbi:MAG TPA: hypothetical protein DIW24_03705 [Bacteroidetes bacterium]|nr:hypothetical protein [Bacteroidota bacterium]
MDWLHPIFLWSLLAAPLAISGYLWKALQRKRARDVFGDAILVERLTEGISTRRRRWKAMLFALSMFFLALSLAGPRIGTKVREVSREGVDLMIALDVSTSMLAEDVAPNRLKKAKFELTKLVEKLNGDRVGLILFGGDAFLQCPVTLDYNALKLFLDISEPDQMPKQGTQYDRMLEVVIKAFDMKGTDKDSKGNRSKVLLVVSDGESHSGDMSTLRNKAAESGITLFTAGVGETVGVTIPAYLNGQRTDGLKTDRNGQSVITKLEEAALQDLGKDGAYFRIARTTSNLSDFSDVLAGMEKTKFGTAKFAAYQEQFQWPLGIALLLLLIEWLLPDRRRKPKDLSSSVMNPRIL